MAAIDDRYRLVGVMTARSGSYRVRTAGLDPTWSRNVSRDITVESLHRSGRSVAYTKPAFAYLFERVA